MLHVLLLGGWIEVRKTVRESHNFQLRRICITSQVTDCFHHSKTVAFIVDHVICFKNKKLFLNVF